MASFKVISSKPEAVKLELSNPGSVLIVDVSCQTKSKLPEPPKSQKSLRIFEYTDRLSDSRVRFANLPETSGKYYWRIGTVQYSFKRSGGSFGGWHTALSAGDRLSGTSSTYSINTNTYYQKVSGSSMVFASRKLSDLTPGDYEFKWRITINYFEKVKRFNDKEEAYYVYISPSIIYPASETTYSPSNSIVRILKVGFIYTGSNGAISGNQSYSNCSGSSDSTKTYAYRSGNRGSSIKYILNSPQSANPRYSILSADRRRCQLEYGADFSRAAELSNERCSKPTYTVCRISDTTDQFILTEANAQKKVFYKGGNLKISANNLKQTTTTIYVEGDISIVGDIKNNTVSGKTKSINRLGNIYLIAAGNIYIDNDVNQIDATLIAKSRGKIYTCANGDNFEVFKSKTDHYDNCSSSYPINQIVNRQLVVRGALIAEGGVIFGRIHKTVLVDANQSLANYDETNTVAGEVIILTSEYFVGRAAILPPTISSFRSTSQSRLPPNF